MQLQQLSEFEITQRKHIELELENIFNSIIPGQSLQISDMMSSSEHETWTKFPF